MKHLSTILGILIFITSIVWGLSFNRYESFITMVIGYWLFFNGLNKILFKESLLTKFKPWQILKIIALGGLAGLVLDFFMTLTHIIEYYTVNNIWIGFLLYLGWGISLLAMYESYVFFSRIINLKFGFKFLPDQIIKCVLKHSAIIGSLLILIVFVFFVHSSIPYWFVILLFLGSWLIVEYFDHKQSKSGLLKTLLDGDWNPVLALLLAAILFSIAWEAMNAPMQHWAYVNLFWLEPRILGVPFIAFFGYFCWFVIFLTSYRVFFDSKDNNLW